MQIKNSSERYGIIATLLHWGMAILIIGLLALGLYMGKLEMSPDKLKLYGLHKSFGACVLFVVTFRALWRITNIIPPMPNTIPKLQQLAAHMAHYALYFFMIAMPLSGWLMSSAAGFPVSVFGLFTLPDLIAANQEQKHFLKEAHEFMAYGLIFTIVAHAGAALKHHFINKDDILRRMLPW